MHGYFAKGTLMDTYLTRFGGETVALFGFGRSSLALLPSLLQAGACVSVRDCKECADRALVEEWQKRGVRFHFGDGWLRGLSEHLLCRSPAVRPDLPEIREALTRGAILSSEYELFAEATPATLFCVTGSDGKTTTATLAATLAKAALEESGRQVFLGGNIGVPLFSLLAQMRACDVVIAELSSFQLMGAPRPPARAVITNISENHLNWHHGMEEYVAAKARILGRGTHAILNADNPYTAKIAHGRADKTLFSRTRSRAALIAEFGGSDTITLANGWIMANERPLLPLSDIRLAGAHNIENYMAALGLILPLVSDPKPLSQVARSFFGVAHRLQEVGVVRGVRYINSSIDSTPTRTAAALSALGKATFLLCGGRGKGLSFAPLRTAIEGRVNVLVLFGECRKEIAAAAEGFGGRVICVPTLGEAIALAKEQAQAGDTVLLSPACTSFDEFRDFEERGECFRRAVLDEK